jgi:hypothetical protein
MDLKLALDEIVALAVKQVSTANVNEVNNIVKSIYNIQAELEKLIPKKEEEPLTKNSYKWHEP